MESDTFPGVTVLEFVSPILSLEALDGLSSALESLAAENGPDPLALCSAHPSVFLAGAHLAEIATLDASSSGPYAQRGRSTIRDLEKYAAPTVAADPTVHAPAAVSISFSPVTP